MTKIMILKIQHTDLIKYHKNGEGSIKAEDFGELSVFESQEKCRVSYK